MEGGVGGFLMGLVGVLIRDLCSHVIFPTPGSFPITSNAASRCRVSFDIVFDS